MKKDKDDNKKKFFILFFVTMFLILFLFWIIYFPIKKTNYESNIVNDDGFISKIYVDDNFSNNTNSYIYSIETDLNYINDYRIINYENQEFLNLIDPYFRFFHPYYYNNEIGFTWFEIDNNYKINFYKGTTINDYYNFLNGNLDPFTYYYSNSDDSISHEYYYDPYNNYIFLIDNTNTTVGIDSSDNGNLGLPSIQKIIEINGNTNQSEVINISELLNYNSDDWYYIDNQNNYYRTLMPTNDLFHFNCLDFDGENIYANSRNLGTFFSFKIIDENGNFLENPEVNWIYSGNFASYYYYYPTDIYGNYPLIYDSNSQKYISNSEYKAQETYDYHKKNNGLQDKFINWKINDTYYDSSNLEELENAQKQYQKELFMGEHSVKLLNSYIEKLGPENFFYNPDSYDPNNLYFSMFDNHAEYLDTSLQIHEEAIDNYPIFNDVNNSYIKIIELNPNQIVSDTGLEPMTARVIFNHQTEQQSEIISSVLFFNENNKNYVAVDQGYTADLAEDYQARFTIYQFDTIDTFTEDFNNFKIVYDINFNSEYIYRAYPIWKNLENVFIQWF